MYYLWLPIPMAVTLVAGGFDLDLVACWPNPSFDQVWLGIALANRLLLVSSTMASVVELLVDEISLLTRSLYFDIAQVHGKLGAYIQMIHCGLEFACWLYVFPERCLGPHLDVHSSRIKPFFHNREGPIRLVEVTPILGCCVEVYWSHVDSGHPCVA